MNELLIATQKASGITEDLDPNYNLVSLHLRGDVNTGRSYNAFSDASTNNFRLTNNGDVRGSSFSPYGTSWSAYFDGTTDYLTVADNASNSLDLGAGQFSIEFWWYPQSVAAGQYPLIGDSTGNWYVIWDNNAGTNAISLGRRAQGNDVNTTGFTLALNTWQHIVVTRQSTGTNDTRIFVDGILRGIGTSSQNYSITTTLGIGGTSTGTSVITGNLASVRLIKGSVPTEYQTSITTTSTQVFNSPTSPLTAVANTTLLVCHTNRFVDGSSNQFAVTRNGDTRISSFSPFLETDTITGSGYFDGTTDYLDVTSALFNPAGAFTIEFWFYATSTNQAGLVSTWASGTSPAQGILIWCNGANTAEIQIGNASTGGTMIATFTWATYLNQWNHIALVRNASNSCAVFLNGNRLAAPVTKSGSPGQSALTVGRGFNNSASAYITCYISNLHFVSGSSLYDPALTTIPVPTVPITKVTDTALLTLQERGAYNTVGFQDESEYQHIITRNGNVAQGTFSPFSQAGWAVNFGGGSSNINLASSADFALGGAFSFECWVYQTSIPNFVDLLDVRTSNEVGSLGISATGFPRWQNGPSTGSLITGSTALTLNQWNYLLFVADASGCSIYLNGQRIANTAQVATWPTSARPCFIGGSFGNASGGSLSGFIADARLIKGSTPYSSTATSVTVPTALLPFVTNTVLQCCRTNRFANTVNSASMTANGTTSIAAFSPFKPPAYDSQVHGGSAYFDGSSDYLEMTYNPAFKYSASQDFCLEFWAYAPSTLTASYVISQVTSNNWGIIVGVGVVTSGRMGVTYGNGSTASTQSLDDTGAFPIGQWVHVVLCRTSGTIALFVNGTRRSTASNTNAINLTGDRGIRIGAHQDGAAAQFWQGYLSGMRSIQGGNPYDATLTTLNVPSVPPTVVGNTSFLLNFTNGGVIDSTGKNVIESMGNSGVVTTALKKYGTGSMFFDATADQQRVTPQAQPVLGNGDWTVEFWAYANATPAGGYCGRFVFSNAGFFIRNASGTVIDCGWSGSGAAITTASGVAAANTWQHIALAKSGNTVNLYVNGVCRGTTASWTWTEYTSEYFIVGSTYTGSEYFNGYIDDFRVTRGLARYTGSTVGTTYFTAPTKALPNRAVASTATTSLTAPTSVEALVIAGGGGGGGRYAGGGGGAGGFREFVGGSALAVSAGSTYQLSIGAGGAASAANVKGGNGFNSIFSTITSTGGGGGGSSLEAGAIVEAGNGGSGGGGSWRSASQVGVGGTGISGQGYAGQTGLSNGTIGGGGGGAGEAGGTDANGYGGDGLQSSITGIATFYAGGGGGGNQGTTTPYQRLGGDGGGGLGAIDAIGGAPSTIQATAGQANTGGGGGAGCWNNTPAGAAGGSGVVILAYPITNKPLTASLGLVYTIDTVTRPGYRVYKFVAGTGTISW